MFTPLRQLLALGASMCMASAATAPAPSSIAAAGAYTLTIRQCDGPLAAAYTPGASAAVTIGSQGDVTIGSQSPLAARMRGSDSLENQGDPVTETQGRFAGVTITKGITIKVINGSAVGGTIKYVANEDGQTKSGTIVFTLARSS